MPCYTARPAAVNTRPASRKITTQKTTTAAVSTASQSKQMPPPPSSNVQRVYPVLPLTMENPPGLSAVVYVLRLLVLYCDNFWRMVSDIGQMALNFNFDDVLFG